MDTILAGTGSPFALAALVTTGWIEGKSNLGRGEPNELVVMFFLRKMACGWSIGVEYVFVVVSGDGLVPHQQQHHVEREGLKYLKTAPPSRVSVALRKLAANEGHNSVPSVYDGNSSAEAEAYSSAMV